MNLFSKFTSFLKQYKNNATIYNIVLVSSIALLVRGAGFIKEIVVANYFGLTELVDTFLIAILIPSFFSGVFLGAFKNIFVPNYINALKSPINIGSFQSSCFLVGFMVAILFGGVSIVFTDVFLEEFYHGHTHSYYQLIKDQFYIILPSIFFWSASSIINALLTIDDEFKLSSFSVITTPIAVIICIIFFKDYLGHRVLAAGTLLGSIIGFVYVVIIASRRQLIILDTPDFNSSEIRLLFKQIPAKLSSGVLSGINPFVDQYFSAQLALGSIAALSYGVKIPMFAIGIIGMATGKVRLAF